VVPTTAQQLATSAHKLNLLQFTNIGQAPTNEESFRQNSGQCTGT
ncbi:uncharacterized protein METZ01_LOCUS116098, partial [marine metagenome]